MKLGVTLVNQKLRGIFREDENGIYVFDENGVLVAKKTNGLLVQFFVESAGKVCLLVVAKNYKRKLGHNLIVTEVAGLFPTNGKMISYKKNGKFKDVEGFFPTNGRTISCSKNGKFKSEEDEKVKGKVRIIGTAEEGINGILGVALPELGVYEFLTKFFKNNEGKKVYIINEILEELKR